MWWIIIVIILVVIIGVIIFAINGGGGGSSSGPYYRGGSGGSGSSSSPLSDVRLKKDIVPLSNSLVKLLALKGVSFNWSQEEYAEFNFDSKRHIGFVAQEVEKVIPELVNTRVDGFKSIEYANLVALLVEAIKEQQLQINKLKRLLNLKE
jgi:hypothetical protein